MSEGISLGELSRRLGRDKGGLSRAASKGKIPRNADGTYHEAAVRQALKARTDPARAKPLKPSGNGVVLAVDGQQPDIETPDDARAAVALIRRVLAEEGGDIGVDALTFDHARTAETILKARARAIEIAVSEKDLTPTKPVTRHVEEAFSGFKKELLALPARYGAQIAAEAGCDVAKLDRALTKVIREYLNGLSAPVVRGQ